MQIDLAPFLVDASAFQRQRAVHRERLEYGEFGRTESPDRLMSVRIQHAERTIASRERHAYDAAQGSGDHAVRQRVRGVGNVGEDDRLA